VKADIVVPGAGLDGERGDVQPGRPSFCPLQKIAKAGLIGLDSCSPQQRVRFRRSHGQVARGDLENPALSAQPRRRQRHGGARCQRELPARRRRRANSAIVLRHCLFVIASAWSSITVTGDRAKATADTNLGTMVMVGAPEASAEKYLRVDGPDAVKGDRKGTEQPTGSLSPSSQDSQATCEPIVPPMRHDRRLAVAGGATAVMTGARVAASRSTKAVRTTIPGRIPGRWNFDSGSANASPGAAP
jgi:hypothetical protein